MKVPDFSEQALLEAPPPGLHIGPAPLVSDSPAFALTEPLVGTYYFYWYDADSGENVVGPEGNDRLTDHPAELAGYSYKLVDWHRRELEDMLEAGLDFLLPVYHGNPADRQLNGPLKWSYEGLAALVEATELLKARGKQPPAIGLFYDTTSLRDNAAHHHVDLSTPDGRAWFYVTIRDFFSQVPPWLRATLEGQPLVFLYDASLARAGADEAGLFDYVREHFAQDFGGAVPYIVAEVSWQISADSTYRWGAALYGLQVDGIACVGPGFDEFASTASTNRKQDREGGAFYARNWEKLLALPPTHRPKIVVVETWNELFEATEIADSREYGRSYIESTRQYADRWKAAR